MMRNRKGERNKIGATGELIARKYLIDKGFTIIADNYQEKWGEIDIIAKKGEILHFVEVKTVSYETKAELSRMRRYWRPEEQVHPKKLARMGRTIETWLHKHASTHEWQIDVVAVRMVPRERYATITVIDNVVC